MICTMCNTEKVYVVNNFAVCKCDKERVMKEATPIHVTEYPKSFIAVARFLGMAGMTMEQTLERIAVELAARIEGCNAVLLPNSTNWEVFHSTNLVDGTIKSVTFNYDTGTFAWY